MISFILNASIIILVIIFITYCMYCFGLSLVIRKLNGRRWLAFVPVLNYGELIRLLGLPARWLGYSVIPYAGTIYSVAIAERLGKVFGRGFVFSTFWLTFGSPIGMIMIGLSKKELNLEIIKKPPPNLNELKKRISRQKNK